MWELIFMLLVLKIPLIYLGWVVWWAIRAVPEPGAPGGDEGLNWKPWSQPAGPRSRRGSPRGPRPGGRRPARGSRARRSRVGA